MGEDKTIKIQRERLYELVWKIPLSKLAREYGLSRYKLNNICNLLRVPIPSYGHWNKLKFGKDVTCAPLLQLNQGKRDTFTIQIKSISANMLLPEFQEDKYTMTKYILDNHVTVCDTLNSPHEFVRNSRKVLLESEPDFKGKVGLNRNNCLCIEVAPENIDRALRIMDALLKGFEANGLRVFSGESGKAPATFAEIFGEKIHFCLKEKHRCIEHKPVDEETERQRHFSMRTLHRWDFIPMGELSLNIEVFRGRGSVWEKRKKWADSTSRPLEEKIGDFIVEAVRIAEIVHRKELELEEERRRQEELNRKKREQEERIQTLEENAKIWSKCQLFRHYVESLEAAFAANKFSEKHREKIGKWILWAKEYIESIDPLNSDSPITYRPPKTKSLLKGN